MPLYICLDYVKDGKIAAWVRRSNNYNDVWGDAEVSELTTKKCLYSLAKKIGSLEIDEESK